MSTNIEYLKKYFLPILMKKASPTTDKNRCRDLEPYIRQTSGNPAEEGEEGL